MFVIILVSQFANTSCIVAAMYGLIGHSCTSWFTFFYHWWAVCRLNVALVMNVCYIVFIHCIRLFDPHKHTQYVTQARPYSACLPDWILDPMFYFHASEVWVALHVMENI
jgi:hypothetical protein